MKQISMNVLREGLQWKAPRCGGDLERKARPEGKWERETAWEREKPRGARQKNESEKRRGSEAFTPRCSLIV